MPTVSCLETIGNSSAAEWNQDSRSDARSLFLALTQFSFIVALEGTKSVLAYTRALSVKLQGHYVDVAYAYREVKNVKAVLQSRRSDVAAFHSQFYNRALRMAGSVDAKESRPRLANRLIGNSIVQISRHKIAVITIV